MSVSGCPKLEPHQLHACRSPAEVAEVLTAARWTHLCLFLDWVTQHVWSCVWTEEPEPPGFFYLHGPALHSHMKACVMEMVIRLKFYCRICSESVLWDTTEPPLTLFPLTVFHRGVQSSGWTSAYRLQKVSCQSQMGRCGRKEVQTLFSHLMSVLEDLF